MVLVVTRPLEFAETKTVRAAPRARRVPPDFVLRVADLRVWRAFSRAADSLFSASIPLIREFM
jgi:hypothetical protein